MKTFLSGVLLLALELALSPAYGQGAPQPFPAPLGPDFQPIPGGRDYEGCLVSPLTVPGGCMGNGSINASAMYINGVAATTIPDIEANPNTFTALQTFTGGITSNLVDTTGLIATEGSVTNLSSSTLSVGGATLGSNSLAVGGPFLFTGGGLFTDTNVHLGLETFNGPFILAPTNYRSENPASAAVYGNVANPANGYSTIYNAFQFSQGVPIPATQQFGQNTIGLQQGLVGTLQIAAGDTNAAGFAVAGYGLTNSNVGAGVVGGGFFGMCGVSNCNEIDGVNEVVSNAPTLQAATGFKFQLILGNQVNINIEPVQTTAGSFAIGTSYTIDTIGTTDFTAIGATSNTVGLPFTATGVGSGNGVAELTTPGALYGYYATGGGNSLSSFGSAFVADLLSQGTDSAWHDGFYSLNGASIVGLHLGSLNGTVSSPPATSASQPIEFDAYTSTTGKQAYLQELADGTLVASLTTSGFAVSAAGLNQFQTHSGNLFQFSPNGSLHSSYATDNSGDVIIESGAAGSITALQDGSGASLLDTSTSFGIRAYKPVQLRGVIFSTLPTCSAGNGGGYHAYLTDAASAITTWHQQVTAGNGGNKAFVTCNETGWFAYAY